MKVLQTPQAADALFAGPGGIRSLCRAVDWRGTSLGAPEDWPLNLRAAVQLCLDALAVPMVIWAGHDFTLIYNEACSELLGPLRHPRALGRPAADAWPELWDRLGPDIRQVFEQVRSAQREDEPIVLARGAGGEAFLTYSSAPVRDEQGQVLAALTVLHETTAPTLAAREEFLSLALNTARTGAWEIDLVNYRTHRSRQHDEIFGYSHLQPEWTFETFLQHVVSEDREQVNRAFRHAIETTTDVNLECRICRPDGNTRWIRVAGRHVREAASRHARLVGIVEDITDAKSAEQALRRSEALARERLAELETLYEMAPIGLCVFDEHLRWVRANRIIAEINGKPIEDHIGRTPSEVVPDVGQQAEEALRTILRTGERLDFEMTGTTAAQPGVERCWSEHWVPIKDSTGRITGISVAAEEVTDRKRAAGALAESEERFRTLAENIAQFAWMADETGWIFWYNQRWYDYTGTTFEDVEGWGWTSVHHPDHVGRVVEKLRRCFNTGASWEDTFPIRGKDGSYRWFLSRAVPIRNAAGMVVRWLGTNTDITEQRAAQEALRASEQRLREADRHKSDFLALLSHELRNPLAAIRTSLGLIDRAGPDSPQAARALVVINRQVRQMARLLDDLLDVTRISKGKLLLQRESAELNAIVRATGEDHSAIFQREGIEFDVRVPREPLRAHVDTARVSQAIGNLLQNAAKFTQRGGRVSLSLEAGGHDTATIQVRDNGAGFEPDSIGRLFEPLVQAAETIQRSRGGMGLGLALVKGLVELHGGTVSGSSEGPGRGAVFTLHLPLETAAGAGPSTLTA